MKARSKHEVASTREEVNPQRGDILDRKQVAVHGKSSI